MEQHRKQQAAEAIAAAEVAETAAVGASLPLLLSNTAPGTMAEDAVETSAGIVKMAALSVESLQETGGVATVSAPETGASLTVSRQNVEQAAVAAAAAGSTAEGPIVMTIMRLSQEASSKLAKDNVLARRLASALKSQAVSVNFWTSEGVRIPLSGLNPPLSVVIEVDDPNTTCAFWDKDAAKWLDAGVTTLPGPEPNTIMCNTTHLTLFGGVVDAVLKLS